MATSETLFVCVNPNEEEHFALQRAIISAQLRDPTPKIHVFVGVDGESVDTRASNDSLTRDQYWFDEVIRQPLKESNLDFNIEICWSHEWQDSIMHSAKGINANSIMLAIPSKVSYRRLTFSESKWELLKKANCPVILVRPGAHEWRKVILAAVNFQALSDEQKELNVRLLTHARWFAENYGADFHVVNAYRDSLNYPDRGKLARETGLPPGHIHVNLGYTDEVVSEVAKELSADLVIMGTLGQNGKLGARRRGNTAMRLIAALDQDVMVIN